MIAISETDVKFILKHLDLTEDLKKLLVSSSKDGLKVTDDQADELRDLCGDKLTEIGFDGDYKANEIGNKLEALIDKLFIG